MGRRLVEIIPYVPIATTLRTGIAIFTYCGTVTFGITGDFAANPDLDVLARGIESGLSELLVAAKRHHRRAATKRRPSAALRGFAAVLRFRRSAQTRSRNSLISAVSRAGRTQSSAKVRVRISLASGMLPREPFRVAEGVDQVDPMSQDQRRRGDGPALVDGRSDGPQQDAVQHGGGFVRVGRGGTDE